MKPENVGVVSGSKTILNCSTNVTAHKIAWHYYANGITRRSPFNGYFIHERDTANYEIVRNIPGQFDLALNSTNQIHAGTYKCEEVGSLVAVTAELVVLGEEITLFCIKYYCITVLYYCKVS